MNKMIINEFTRTEVFFTAQLDNACKYYQAEISKLLVEELKLKLGTKIIDHSFEVCFFRDYAKKHNIDFAYEPEASKI